MYNVLEVITADKGIMSEYFILSCIEFFILLIVSERVLAARNGWANPSIWRDNTHIRMCYLIRKWSIPSLFLILNTVAVSSFAHHAHELAELFFMNVLVLMSSAVLGLLLGESAVQRYRVGR
ncbi:MAG TPA: hypothetical protein PLH27_09595 [bacterium]|nr:hypothetical protein [bacterium]HMW36178.1 hypothetical protein [bacterium]HMY36947.1 hypothetical protein [bacterium]HMZ05324.1 hypothetical protein [bacterium]HNB10435.1 hypothetical protein [bacterium]